MKAKRPRDPNQLAKLIVDISTRQVEDINLGAEKDPKNMALGADRAEQLSPAKREEIARDARKDDQ